MTFNRENALPTIDFYDVGDSWVESTPTFTQITASLKIMGGDADVDNYLKETRSNVQDLEAAVIKLKSKALQHKFEEIFLYGNSATDAKQFDGLGKLIDTATASSQVMITDAGAAGGIEGALVLNDLRKLIDAVKGGKPDALIMSKRSARKIKTLTEAAGFNLETEKTQFGNRINIYDGVPFWVTDFQLDTHLCAASVMSDSTSGGSSVIYAVSLGEGALAGLTSPGHIQVEPIGSLEGKDATRTRIKWYVSLALFASVKAAALIGVID